MYKCIDFKFLEHLDDGKKYLFKAYEPQNTNIEVCGHNI